MLSPAIVLAALLSAHDPGFRVNWTCDSTPCVMTATLAGKVNSEGADFVEAILLTAYEQKADAVLFQIDSSGGSLPAGRRIAKAIARSAVPVHCWVSGIAASAAAWLLQACGDRAVAPDARVVVHRPTYFLVGSLSETELRVAADELVVLRHEMLGAIGARAGKTLHQVEALTTDEVEWITTGIEAVRSGLADRVTNLEVVKSELGIP